MAADMRSPLTLVALNTVGAANTLRQIEAQAPVTWEDIQATKKLCLVASLNVDGDEVVKVAARDHILSSVGYYPDLTAIAAQLGDITRNLNTITQRLDAMSANMNERFNAMDAKVKGVDRKVDALDQKVDQVKMELSRRIDEVKDDLTAQINDNAMINIGTQGEPNVVDAKEHITGRLAGLDGRLTGIDGRLLALDARVQNRDIFRDNRRRLLGPLQLPLKVKNGTANVNLVCRPSAQPQGIVYLSGEVGESHPSYGNGIQTNAVHLADILRIVYYYNDTMGLALDDSVATKQEKLRLWLINESTVA